MFLELVDKTQITEYHNLMAKKKSQVQQYTESMREWMAKRAKTIRIERDLLQKDVATQAGMPPSRLAEVEAGKFHLAGSTFSKLLIVYQLHPSEFFAGAPRPPKPKKKKE